MDDVPRKNRELHAKLQSILGAEYVMQPRDFSTIADWQEVFHLPAEVIALLVENEVQRTREKKRSLAGVFKRMDKTAHDWAENGVCLLYTSPPPPCAIRCCSCFCCSWAAGCARWGNRCCW